jgi:hypothetical protein
MTGIENAVDNHCLPEGAHRHFAANLFFPFDSDREFPLANYFGGPLYEAYRPLFSQLPAEAQDQIQSLKKFSFARVPIDLSIRDAPLVIFSPGYDISADFYQIAEQIASFGYIVMALTHTYASGPTYLPIRDCVVAQIHTPEIDPATDPAYIAFRERIV